MSFISFSNSQVIASVATLHKDRNSLDSTIDSVRIHLSTFKGVSRRFELLGTVNGCQIYDDYAHHPTEVRAVLQAARQKFPSHALWVVFQAHTFRFSLKIYKFLDMFLFFSFKERYAVSIRHSIAMCLTCTL